MTARTEKLLRKMTRASALQETRDVMRLVLYSVSADAVRIAQSVVFGGPLGASIEANLARARFSTQQLRRKAGRNPHPLKEWERLANSIVAQVTGDSAIIGVQPGKRTARRRAGQGDMELAQLALNLEQGFTIRITPKARAYFRFRALELMGREGAASAAGDIMAAAFGRQAHIWWGLASAPSAISVPPRPFLRPSVELAAERFIGSKAPALMRHAARVWIEGKGAAGTYVDGVAAGIGPTTGDRGGVAGYGAG
ncbi:hypothetical protein [Microbacterium sp.]|uniref:hypothetical protein n=1 Tax=Microbacterium sp. TaxID=51671 RepID=UPI0027326ADA|nr:hypothetical protein [Microbacterium sp.]MDP3951604.1 hypothetical protein [Microbacterium sp.]